MKRKVQDLIDAYVNESRFVWEPVKLFLEGKIVFKNFLDRTRVDSGLQIVSFAIEFNISLKRIQTIRRSIYYITYTNKI
jgi:hypothetical protein